MPKEIEWNNSALLTVEQCGEKARRRLVEREYIPGNLGLKRGSAVHAVIADAHMRQLEARKTSQDRTEINRALPSTEEARDLAATQFDAEVKKGVTIHEKDIEEFGSSAKAIGHAKDVVAALVPLYVSRVAPTILPAAVERRIVIKPKDTDLVVHGKMDLVEELPSGGEAIRDQKTSEKAPKAQAADESSQLTFYSMLRSVETGKMPESVSLDFLVRTPTGRDVYVKRLESHRDSRDVEILARRLNAAVEAVKRGVFVPNTAGWWCSSRWCEYYSTCPYVRGEGR